MGFRFSSEMKETQFTRNPNIEIKFVVVFLSFHEGKKKENVTTNELNFVDDEFSKITIRSYEILMKRPTVWNMKSRKSGGKSILSC